MSLSAEPPTIAEATTEESSLPKGDSSEAAKKPGLLKRLSTGTFFSSSKEEGEAKESDGESSRPNLIRRISSSVMSFSRRNSQILSIDPSEIPPNFLKASKGNVNKAAKKWAISKEWREENDIDHILEKPHPDFETLKAVYPNYLHGRDLQGNVISVEIPGSMNIKLLKSSGLTPKDMAMQLSLHQEYVWTKLTPSPDARIVTLMDAKGISLTKLASSDAVALMRACSEVLNNHYPERVLRILVVNAPRFFGPIFKMLSTVLPASVRDQLQICNKVSDIEKYIAIENIPIEYGGRSTAKLGEAEEERGLKELIECVNARHHQVDGVIHEDVAA